MDEQSLAFKAAMLGAFAALAGASVGAIASVVIAWWGFEREEDASNRQAEETAYIEFLTEANAFANTYRNASTLRVHAPKLDALSQSQGFVHLYGDEDAHQATVEMVAGISAALDEYEDSVDYTTVPDSAWDEYDKATAHYLVAVQTALEID